jgi:2-keto-4-pentenoate hydratase/2-oxohepta-3-ene-1,7-dioic acid hydratase in catechol pathway
VTDGADGNGSGEAVVDPWKDVSVETRVNGEVRQSGNTRDFIFALDVVLRFITQVMTLYPGDLIATGTPSGVGPVVAGDVVEIAIPGVGVLRNPVADEG